MKSSPFFKQVELLLRTLPYIAAEKCFALKGGTAINLFVRDMPRLSVDVDLTYLPVEPREESLGKIGYCSCPDRSGYRKNNTKCQGSGRACPRR